MKRKGARVSPCRTPVVTENGSVSPSGVETNVVEPSYRLLIACMIGFGIPYNDRIVHILSLDTESKAFEKSTKTAQRAKFFIDEMPCMSLRSARMGSSVDLEGRNPF